MNTNKIIITGIAGAVISFIVSNIFYNYLFKTYFDSNTYPTDFSTIKWWASLTSTLLWGFLFAYILEQAKAASIKSGAMIAGIVGLIIAANFDLGFYSVGVIYTDLTVIAADVLLTGFIATVIGATIVYVGGKVKTAA